MILSPFLEKKKSANRKGIVFFVVIGAIAVLTVLVISYNYLVLGKSNESREILKHLRAEKCAQSVCRFVISHLISDLNDETTYAVGDEIAGSGSIKEVLSAYNDPDKLSEELCKNWLSVIDPGKLVNELLVNTTGNEIPDEPLIELGFSDVTTLNSLKSSRGIGDEVTFFEWEKVGRLTVRVTIKIGKSRAVWQETRPFKVVFPFPIPITKFNFYWTDGADDALAFNTVSIKSDTGESANGKLPFLFDNRYDDTDTDNKTGDMWLNRGWIYVGGDYLILNRAGGSKKYGQNYYSYKEPETPLTLMLDFPSDDRWGNHLYHNERLGFRVAYWGFSNSLTGSSNQTWKMILKSEYDKNPPDSTQKDKFWNSSCLHLFSDKEILNSNSASNYTPSITRVIGKVEDRFLEMGYLLPVSSNDSFFAAVIGVGDGENDTEYNSLKENYSTETGNKYSFENFLFFSDGYDFENDSGNEGADALQKYFEALEYSVNNVSAVDYYKVMSKSNTRSMDVTYNVISEYSKNNSEVSLPPGQSVPETNNLTFKPTGNYGSKELELGSLPESIGKMDVSEIGKVEDSTLGLSLRTCYEITGSSDGIQSLLNSYLGSSSNGFDLNLKNLVYKVTPDSENVRFSNMSVKTPGTIYSDGPITVGTFLPPTGNSEDTAFMLLAGKGAITVNNSGGNNEVRAYLVALGEGGTVKASRKDVPLLIRGGMAVKEFKPENIPDKGGYLLYNGRLNPLKSSFKKDYLGFAIGPKGCNP